MEQERAFHCALQAAERGENAPLLRTFLSYLTPKAYPRKHRRNPCHAMVCALLHTEPKPKGQLFSKVFRHTPPPAEFRCLS